MDTEVDEVSLELSRLLAKQTVYFQRPSHSPDEVSEYERVCDRIRELFEGLESKAA